MSFGASGLFGSGYIAQPTNPFGSSQPRTNTSLFGSPAPHQQQWSYNPDVTTEGTFTRQPRLSHGILRRQDQAPTYVLKFCQNVHTQLLSENVGSATAPSTSMLAAPKQARPSRSMRRLLVESRHSSKPSSRTDGKRTKSAPSHFRSTTPSTLRSSSTSYALVTSSLGDMTTRPRQMVTRSGTFSLTATHSDRIYKLSTSRTPSPMLSSRRSTRAVSRHTRACTRSSIPAVAVKAESVSC